MKNIKVSIIVSASHNQEILKKCLQALVPQLNATDELIVVSDISIPSIQRWLSIFQHKQNFYCYTISKSLSLRAFGLKHAREDVIAFLDDDCLVSPKWLWFIKKLCQRSREKTVFQGKMDIIISGKSLLNDVFRYLIKQEWDQLIRDARTNIPIYLNFFHSETFFLRRTILRRLRDFFGSESLFLDQGTMMTVGLQLLGYKIEYFPNLRVRHFKARLTIFNFIQKFFNKGFIAGKMEKKYKARSEIISFFKDYIPSDNSSLSLNIKMFASKFVYKGIGIWMQVIFFLALKKIFYSIGKLYGRWINI